MTIQNQATERRRSSVIGWILVLLLAPGLAGVCKARGPGIKAGDGRMHPYIELTEIYDSNTSYFADDAVADLVLRIRPGLTLSFPSEWVSLEFDGQIGYDHYFGAQDQKTRNLSTITGEAGMQVGFNSEGQVSLFVEDVFYRTGDPRYTSLTGRFDRTDNETRARLQIKPVDGSPSFGLAYGFFLDWFDQTDQGEAEAMSSYAHRIYFSANWKFLPKTALTLDFDTDLRRYPNEYSLGGRNKDLNAIRVTAGVIGQVAPNISVVARLGYGDTLISDQSGYAGSDYRSVIGQVEGKFKWRNTIIQIGYLRDFQPVVMFAYFGQDRVYARYSQRFLQKFALAAEFGFDWLIHGVAVQAETASRGQRSDGLVSLHLAFSYYIKNWMTVGVAYDLQSRFSDWSQPEGGSVDYTKNLVSIHVGVDY